MGREYEPGFFRLTKWALWVALPMLLLHGLATHFTGFWAAHSLLLGTVTIPGVGPVPVADLAAQPIHTFESVFRAQVQAALSRFP